MRSTFPRAATAGALLIASLGLAACSTGTTSTVTHTPALQTLGGRDTARSGTQAAILIAETTNGISLPGGPTPASIARRVFAMTGGRGTLATGNATGVCLNGQKQSQVTNANKSRTTTTDYYYDAACTNLEEEEVITITSPSTPGNTDGTGTITSYGTNGAVRVVQSLTFTATTTNAGSGSGQNESLILQDNASTSVGGTVVAALGATCTGPVGSATVNCAIAHYGTSGGVTFGEVIGIAATAGTGGANNSANVNVSFFLGNGLGIAQSGTAWGVTGGSQFNAATGTYSYTSSGTTGNGTLTLTDSLYTYTETAKLSGSGLSVSIVQNPNAAFNTTTNIATATVDAAGNGVLSYSDGTTEPIAGGLLGF